MQILQIILYLFFAAAAVQIVYYLVFFSRYAWFKTKAASIDNKAVEPASIVICARNEADNLLAKLPLIFEQDYPEYEVVVVNDCSWDGTADVLRAFEHKHANLKVVTINETSSQFPGKKFALTLGIKAAKNDLLVLTDADCEPRSNQWLRVQAAQFQPGTQVVLGYGAFRKDRGLLNRLIRFDAFYVALQYLSLAVWGMPYMGVGRNLAYRKSLFFQNKGFASHQNIPSGDDDLFVNEVATGSNTRIVDSPDSHTVTPGKQTFAEWFTQKRRHITTGGRYKWRDKVLLGLLTASQTGFFLLMLILLVFNHQPQLVLAVFGARLLMQLFTFGFAMRKLGEADLLYLFPLYELILTAIYPIVFLANLLLPKPSWKT